MWSGELSSAGQSVPYLQKLWICKVYVIIAVVVIVIVFLAYKGLKKRK